jgi:hypothetical protein
MGDKELTLSSPIYNQLIQIWLLQCLKLYSITELEDARVARIGPETKVEEIGIGSVNQRQEVLNEVQMRLNPKCPMKKRPWDD